MEDLHLSGSPLTPAPSDFTGVDYAIPSGRPRMGMAITALVCGILGLVLCLPAGIVGLILGIVATVRANREPQRYSGKGLAIGGICTGGASIVLGAVTIPLMIAILLPSLSRAREIAKRAVDASNLRGIGQAVMVYAADNNRAFPPDLQALIVDGSCTPQQFIDPSSGHVPPACDYFYVTGLTTDDPADWIIAYGDPAHHAGEGANVLYLSGAAQFLKEKPGGQFTAEIDRFKAAYEKQRGAVPRILAPQ